MLMSRLSSLAHKLLVLMFMLMLASQVRTGLIPDPKTCKLSKLLQDYLPNVRRPSNYIRLTNSLLNAMM